MTVALRTTPGNEASAVSRQPSAVSRQRNPISLSIDGDPGTSHDEVPCYPREHADDVGRCNAVAVLDIEIRSGDAGT
jgi:hypothetical protein